MRTSVASRIRCAAAKCMSADFGRITFDWEAKPRTATLQIRDAENAVRVEETLTNVERLLRTLAGAIGSDLVGFV